MRLFLHNPKPTQQEKSVKSLSYRRIFPMQKPEPVSSASAKIRFGYDFSQLPIHTKSSMNDIQQIARNGTTGTTCPLPHLDQIQRSFGPQQDLSNLKAYVGGKAAEAALRMGAEAYTNGEQVAFRDAPSLHTAAHEAAHVVQQRSGIRIPEGFGAKGDVHERHADAVANCVVAGGSCEHLFDAYSNTAGNRPFASPAIQCLAQDLPYAGALRSYLNPMNQAIRAVLPGLSPAQKALLDGIFGNSLATSIIRLNPNSILAAGRCYRTTGNIINMPGAAIDDGHLIHEAAHVWQSQNSLYGFEYAVSALEAQAIAQVLGGDWHRAYDYHNVESARIPWRYWNAEQQAQWIQDNRRLPSGWMLEAALPSLPGVQSTGL
ncbi:MAG: hypothetical protein A4E49_01141 [Methanosaeta sp. PtaU1.Bin112]|nr:MAG: hypothetical protein A4E49_01141 [Methanosaeta sp. PtaU1.Bin112]